MVASASTQGEFGPRAQAFDHSSLYIPSQEEEKANAPGPGLLGLNTESSAVTKRTLDFGAEGLAGQTQS